MGVKDKGKRPHFGTTKGSQNCSQGPCWDPKNPSTAKRQKKKKKKKRKHHPFLCMVTNSTLPVARAVPQLLLDHISPHSTFPPSLLSLPWNLFWPIFEDFLFSTVNTNRTGRTGGRKRGHGLFQYCLPMTWRFALVELGMPFLASFSRL